MVSTALSALSLNTSSCAVLSTAVALLAARPIVTVTAIVLSEAKSAFAAPTVSVTCCPSKSLLPGVYESVLSVICAVPEPVFASTA